MTDAGMRHLHPVALKRLTLRAKLGNFFFILIKHNDATLVRIKRLAVNFIRSVVDKDNVAKRSSVARPHSDQRLLLKLRIADHTDH